MSTDKLQQAGMDKLRRAQTAIYLACEESVAADVSGILKWSGDRIEELERAPPQWRTIDTAPTGEDDFFLVCCDDPRDDRSPFVVRGSIFKSARTHPAQHHLSMAHLTHWQPLPAKPGR